MLDKFHDECAVVGIIGHPEAANLCYLGLYSLQHRGQEGAGIVSTDSSSMYMHKAMGLVADVFTPSAIESLKGSAAIGHTRYATFGGKNDQNLQPLMATFLSNSFSIAHNGNFINASKIRSELESSGSIFSTTSDSEIVLHLAARATYEESLVDKLKNAFSKAKGAYSIVVLTRHKLIAARDPAGVRPLSLARLGDSYVVASETCAFDLMGAKFIRDINPGEILEITDKGEVNSYRIKEESRKAFCVFEYIYFARPDSTIDSLNVYNVRKSLGRELARESSVEVDLVIPVPDSGTPASIGFANEIKKPFELGLIRNHYVGRTFIEPKQSIRDFGVKIKLNANKELLEGKKIAVIDDSIVRGTTSKKIVKMLKDAGAKEVHFRISSPPTISPCYYGIDTPSSEELTAAKYSVEQIRDYIGADSLSYISVEGMYRALGRKRNCFCDACFTKEYPLGVSSGNMMPSCWTDKS